MSKTKKPAPVDDEWTFTTMKNGAVAAYCTSGKTWHEARAKAAIVLQVEPDALTCTKRPR